MRRDLGPPPDYIPAEREHLYPGAGTGDANLGYVPDPGAPISPERIPNIEMIEKHGWGWRPEPEPEPEPEPVPEPEPEKPKKGK